MKKDIKMIYKEIVSIVERQRSQSAEHGFFV